MMSTLEFEPGPRWWEAIALIITLSLAPQSPSGEHCTDEAQKAETVLSAVSYIYIYIYI